MSFLSVFEEAEVKHETSVGPTPANLISQGLRNKQTIHGKYLIAPTDVMNAPSLPSLPSLPKVFHSPTVYPCLFAPPVRLHPIHGCLRHKTESDIGEASMMPFADDPAVARRVEQATGRELTPYRGVSHACPRLDGAHWIFEEKRSATVRLARCGADLIAALVAQ